MVFLCGLSVFIAWFRYIKTSTFSRFMVMNSLNFNIKVFKYFRTGIVLMCMNKPQDTVYMQILK